MPKVPRDRSHDEVVRFLKRHGWVASPGAKHTVMSKGDAILTVPRHAVIKTGTLAAILDRAGISTEEAARDL